VVVLVLVKGGEMGRTVFTRWDCLNCNKTMTDPGLARPQGWIVLVDDTSELCFCSIDCLNEVAHNWVKNRKAETRKG